MSQFSLAIERYLTKLKKEACGGYHPPRGRKHRSRRSKQKNEACGGNYLKVRVPPRNRRPKQKNEAATVAGAITPAQIQTAQASHNKKASGQKLTSGERVLAKAYDQLLKKSGRNLKKAVQKIK